MGNEDVHDSVAYFFIIIINTVENEKQAPLVFKTTRQTAKLQLVQEKCVIYCIDVRGLFVSERTQDDLPEILP